jgi:hypothetical protein
VTLSQQQVLAMSETNVHHLLPSSFSNIPIITSQTDNWMLSTSALLCSLMRFVAI